MGEVGERLDRGICTCRSWQSVRVTHQMGLLRVYERTGQWQRAPNTLWLPTVVLMIIGSKARKRVEETEGGSQRVGE